MRARLQPMIPKLMFMLFRPMKSWLSPVIPEAFQKQCNTPIFKQKAPYTNSGAGSFFQRWCGIPTSVCFVSSSRCLGLSKGECSLNKKEIHQIAAIATKQNIIRLTMAPCPPKRNPTISNWKMPMEPQLIPPIINRTNIMQSIINICSHLSLNLGDKNEILIQSALF